jgi:hypothetical protein
VGKPLGTVIRIERNQSERTAAAKMPEAKPLPQTQQQTQQLPQQQQGQHWQNGEAHKKQQVSVGKKLLIIKILLSQYQNFYPKKFFK